MHISPSGPRIVEPRLGAVGIARAMQAVGLGLLASAAVSLVAIAVPALGATTTAPDLLSRAAALGPLVTGPLGGLLTGLAATIAAMASPRVLHQELSAGPDVVPSPEGLSMLNVGELRIAWGLVPVLPALLWPASVSRSGRASRARPSASSR